MKTRVLLLDGSADLGRVMAWVRPGCSEVVCLSWLAPETLQALSRAAGAAVRTLNDLSGGMDDLREEALRITDLVCAMGPRHHGIPWAEYIREPLYRELENAATFRWAVDGILERAGKGELEIHHLLSPENAALATHVLGVRQRGDAVVVPIPDVNRFHLNPGGHIPGPPASLGMPSSCC